MNEDFELQPHYIATPLEKYLWESSDVEFLQIATPDCKAPSLEDLHKAAYFIKKQIDDDKQIYVHCKAGKGRSVLAIVCYFIQYENKEVEEAFQYLQSIRKHIHPSKQQIEAAHEYKKIVSLENFQV